MMKQQTPRILVIDDEKSLREFLSIVLTKEGYTVVVSEDGEGGIERFKNEPFDLVLTDIKMPTMDGLQVLKIVKETSPETEVLMITAFASTGTAVEAMKLGAYDYISKPFQIDEVKLIIEKALEKRRLEADNRRLRRQLDQQTSFDEIIGKSPAMQKVYDIIRKVADTKSNVLIMGESGTGKELIARAIHSSSSRRGAPFVAVNCSALPEPLLESELFGHVRGAFTGAHTHKEGLFETANGGTLFLDEIGETPPSIQVKLLRVLEEREFRRIGGTKNIQVDTRIVAATNRNLEMAVSQGKFREDLYYRLDVIPIFLPPLRERTEDIAWLTEHFLCQYGPDNGSPKKISPDALRILQTHEWKGNVRELENLIERVVAMVPHHTIGADDIESCLDRPMASRQSPISEIPLEGIDLESVMEDLERSFIAKALKRTGGIKRKAAKLLGLNMRSFRYRLQKYQMIQSRSQPEDEGNDASSPEE